jgi:glycine oxidase
LYRWITIPDFIMTDCCVIGAGIIGLSIARELAGHGFSVVVLDRGSLKLSSSWAAAGIFPPAPMSDDPGDALTHWSDELHRMWAAQLLEETGIDNGLRTCGGLHLTASAAHRDQINSEVRSWQQRGARATLLDSSSIVDIEPCLGAAVSAGLLVGGYLLPDEMQIRPPRHLEALESSCKRRGVVIHRGVTVESIQIRNNRAESVLTSEGHISAGAFCLSSGAWSQKLAAAIGLDIPTRPIRGQIALIRMPEQILKKIVNRGLEYLVPRTDGYMLVGSTIEDVGFDATTTPQAIARLLAFATQMIPSLVNSPVEQSWAGLRPGSIDGVPSLGPVSVGHNLFVASGHFRAGLHQSTGTAVLMAELIRGVPPSLDPRPFNPLRPKPLQGHSAVDAYLARTATDLA